MGSGRMGEVLSEIVSLSTHDVCEILEQQSATRQRFGQIALSWGLCRPDDVWEAWRRQVIGRTPRVELRRTGVDAQATSYLPGSLAVRLGALPIRVVGHQLIVAASDASLAHAAELLPRRAPVPVSFVLADAADLDAHLQRYYAADHQRHQLAAAVRRCGGGACGKARCAAPVPPARGSAKPFNTTALIRRSSLPQSENPKREISRNSNKVKVEISTSRLNPVSSFSDFSFL